MIIRHDLETVLLHVPKCAGKLLRMVFLRGVPPDAFTALWDYGWCPRLRRYVDHAHLPMQDLRMFEEFDYLERYRVVACVRDPYRRLPSAVNEYYRQKSKRLERRVLAGGITAEMKRRYYKQLPSRHAQLDPRFIHSLPIHHFTHFGDEPKADRLLRCETLRSDVLALAVELGWPQMFIDDAAARLKDEEPAASEALSPEELALANRLYAVDFATFGYARQPCTDDGSTSAIRKAGRIDVLRDAPEVRWHWGPTAHRCDQALRPVRR